MAIVARGLGQPEDGGIVVGGLGASEPAGPGGFLNLSLSVEATSETTIAAEVIGDTPVVTPPQGGGNTSPGLSFAKPKRQPKYVEITLIAESTATALIVADVTYNFDAELEELLLVGAL
jgi:hypothetical protein